MVLGLRIKEMEKKLNENLVELSNDENLKFNWNEILRIYFFFQI